MKVFLGGTCAGWKWRDELQPLLKVVDDSNKRPEKTIFLNLYKTYERSGESKQMAHSLKAVENMLKANGVVVFSGEKALLEVADYLNKAVSIQGE